MSEKKKINFTIMSDQKKHKTLDLSSISPVILDLVRQEAFVDMGALHARSQVEKGIKFVTDLAEVPNGEPYCIVWVSTENGENGAYIHGAAACKMLVDKENRRGFKILAEHVNSMDAAMKGRIKLEILEDTEKKLLREFIQNFKAELWENSSEELKSALA